MYKKLKFTNNQYGFTLIELLVVIAILAVLSVVAFAVFSNVSKGARDARKKGDINAIAKALEVNYINGRYVPLQDSQFASGTIPKTPEGGDYTSSFNPDQSGFQICTALGDGGSCSSPSPACFCKHSTQGIYVPAPTSTPTPGPTPTPTPTPGPTYVAFTKPIEINVNAILYGSNSTDLAGLGPLVPRGIVLNKSGYDAQYTDQKSKLDMVKSAVNNSAIIFGSVAFAQSKLTDTEANYLKYTLKVTTLEYNVEPTVTPNCTPDPCTDNGYADEFNKRFNADVSNPIVQFANLAKSKGFNVIWVPTRADTYDSRYTNEVLSLIYKGTAGDGSNGMDGIALQEQLKIEDQCVDTRTSEVNTTLTNHRNNAGGKTLIQRVQIMASRCYNGEADLTVPTLSTRCPSENLGQYTYQHCDLFTDQINSTINSLDIWASGSMSPYDDMQRLVNFVTALRRAN